MTKHVVFALSSIAAVCLSIFCVPLPVHATELDSIYVRVRISPDRYEKWLASPMKSMFDFDDWHEMTPEWLGVRPPHLYKWDLATMDEMIKAFEKEAADWTMDKWTSRPFVRYDAENGALTFAQLFFAENYVDFALYIAAFRTLADFKDTDDPDFLVVCPFFWSPGYLVIMEIGKGYTKFYTEATAPAAFKTFLKEAAAHFNAEMDQFEDEPDAKPVD